MNERVIEHNEGSHQVGGAEIASAWTSLFTGPLVWVGQMQLSYSLVPSACRDGHTLVLHLVSVLSVLLIIGGGWLGWRSYRAASSRWPDDKAGMKPALSFLSALALTVNALFLTVSIAQWIPKFIFDPCQR